MVASVKPFTLIDELLASPVEPLAASDVGNRVRLAEQALLSLVSGDGVTWAHWATCTQVTNFMEVFVGLGFAVDHDGLVDDAHDALRVSRLLAETGGPLRLSGAGAGSVLALIEDFGQCLREAPARSAVRAMRLTDKMVRALK